MCYQDGSRFEYVDLRGKITSFKLTFPLLQADMITNYNIIGGLVEVPHQDLFTISCNTTRSNGLKLDKERANTNSRLNFFTNRIIIDWNTQLPADIVNALDTTSFKTLLDIFVGCMVI